MSFLDDYEPVEDRLRAFWSEHPDGRIATDLVSEAKKPGDVIIFKASVWKDTRSLGPGGIIQAPSQKMSQELAAELAERWSHADGRTAVLDAGFTYQALPQTPDSTGYAHQRLLEAPPSGRNGRPNESAPEWTSPWEVAETSAIGRALANLGYAAKGKRPSREEISKASASPPAAPLVTRSADEQASSERSTPADADGGLASEADAPPISSAAPEAAGTEAGGTRQEPAGHGEGPAGSEGSPQPPTSAQERIASLWKQLDEYTGSRRKALNEVTRITKRSFKAGRDEHLVTEEELALTLSTVLKEAG